MAPGAWDLSQVCHAQRRDSGQLTGGSAEESSIRPASYLQVAEKDTGGCEQKWNLLKRRPAAQTLQGMTRNSIQNFSPGAGPEATTVTPKALAPAVCTADRQAWKLRAAEALGRTAGLRNQPGHHCPRNGGFSAPSVYSRPGVLCTAEGLGARPRAKRQRSMKGEYLVVCLPVKGGKLSASLGERAPRHQKRLRS